MNSAVVWTVGSFLGGRVLERVVAAALGSTSGRRLMQRWDQAGADPVRASDAGATMGGRDCQSGDYHRPYRGGSDELAKQR